MHKLSKFAFFLACLVSLPGCIEIANDAEEWSATPIGKAQTFYWCDSEHIGIGHVAASTVPEVIEYIDLTNNLKRTRIELKGTPRLRMVGCEKDAVIAEASSAPKQVAPRRPNTSDALYAIPAGGSPRLLARLKDHTLNRASQPVHSAAQTIVSSMPRVPAPNGYVTDPACATDVAAGYRTICLDVMFSDVIPLRRFVIAKHFRDEQAFARAADGKIVQVSNNSPIPKGAPGSSERRVLALHDFGGAVVQWLAPDTHFFVDTLSYVASPDELYLYSPCKLKTKSNFDRDYDRVCRTRLDGQGRPWEEVFFFDRPNELRAGISDISVDANGNIYFNMAGASGPNGGIWKFERTTRTIAQVVRGAVGKNDSAPMVAPNGARVLFLRNDVLHMAEPRAATKYSQVLN